jgi:carbon starvation protein
MVAGWGYILILGVTDPLGGINTFFPLFGIANQLLAAIALAVCMAIAAKQGSFKFLWIVGVPLVFAAVVTITASFHKIFSPVPAVGYFANNAAFAKALADGKTSFGTAKTLAAMEAVVRNTMVQGVLSVVFVVLSIVVIIAAIVATLKAFRDGGGRSHEDAPRPSRVFAPSGLIPTAAERELAAAWAKVPATKLLDRPGHQ